MVAERGLPIKQPVGTFKHYNKAPVSSIQSNLVRCNILLGNKPSFHLVCSSVFRSTPIFLRTLSLSSDSSFNSSAYFITALHVSHFLTKWPTPRLLLPAPPPLHPPTHPLTFTPRPSTECPLPKTKSLQTVPRELPTIHLPVCPAHNQQEREGAGMCQLFERSGNEFNFAIYRTCRVRRKVRQSS